MNKDFDESLDKDLKNAKKNVDKDKSDSYNEGDLEEVLRVALNRYDASYQAERAERDLMQEDMRFTHVEGAQWEEFDTNQRRNRPRFSINKIAVQVHHLVGEQRQNRIMMKVRSSKGLEGKETAEVYEGLIRNIENQSNFKDVMDSAYNEIVTCGMGAWQVDIDFQNPDSFERELKLKSIKSACTSVFYDPADTSENRQDSMWMMVTEDISRSAFESRYPGKINSSFLSNNQTNFLTAWQTRDTVRIADYYLKVPTTKVLALMSDGNIMELDDDTKTIIDELEQEGITVVQTRERITYSVKHYKISNGDILEGPHDWPGNMIPVVVVFGYSAWINSQFYAHGITRPARDSQRVYNYATSQAIEVSSLSPKDPFWVTPIQTAGFKREYEQFNVSNTPFMPYNHDPKEPGPPKRSGAPAVQEALINQIRQADQDLQSVTGMFAPTMGDAQFDQSGRAVLALQRQGNTTTHQLLDNLVKGVHHTGKLMLDLIPKVYNQQMQVMILKEDGETMNVDINRTVFDAQTNKEVSVLDLSHGTYDITAHSGPSYASKRVEELNMMIKMAEGDERFRLLSSDLVAEVMDFEKATELTKRMRGVMLRDGLIEPNEEELAAMQANAPQPSPGEILQLESMKLDNEIKASNIDFTRWSTEKIRADTTHKHSQTLQNQVEAIETKTKINKNLDELGNPIDFPILPGEMEAQSRSIDALHKSMDVDDLMNPPLPEAEPQNNNNQ